MSDVAQTVARARAACAVDDDEVALALALDAAGVLDPVLDAAIGWELAALLVELGDQEAGLALAARLGEQDPSVEATLRRTALLVGAGEEDSAASLLREAAQRHGSPTAIIGQLVERALAGVGWGVLDDLPTPAPEAAAMIAEARRRAQGIALDAMDSRRLAYVLGEVVVLGGSEDERDVVSPYWFLNVDEHEAAWFARRVAAWLEVDQLRPPAVHAADDGAGPVALALAAHLGVPCDDLPGALRVYSQLERVEDAVASDGVSVCLGVAQPLGWGSLLAPPPLDAVGVFAPVETTWSDVDDEGQPPPSREEVARRITAELARLPRDPSLTAIAAFYRGHRARARQRR